MVITYTGITNSARQISMNNRIVITVGEHVIAEDALAGGDIAVGIEEPAPLRVIISAPEIIQPRFLEKELATELFSIPGGGKLPSFTFING